MNIYAGKNLEADQKLWQSVVNRDKAAFEQVVQRFQSAVIAAAYNVCGDFEISQDIAQETFLAAWMTSDKLRDARRIGGWLKGISRNLARNWNRSKQRVSTMNTFDKMVEDRSSGLPDASSQMILEEEKSAIRKNLERLPDNYKSVLDLFYNNGATIEEIAVQLNLKTATARQRLFRGREMLRISVSKEMTGVIDRKAPSRTFTARVMAGLATVSAVSGAASKVSAAGTGAMGTAGAVSGASIASKLLTPGILGIGGGILGGLIGTIGGLGGAFIGTWLPAEMAPTETERQLLKERMRPLRLATILFTLATVLLSLSPLFLGTSTYLLIGLFCSLVPFISYTIIHSFRTNQLVQQLRKEITPEEDPNQSYLAQKSRLNKFIQKDSKPQIFRKGRSYESEMKFLGMPLLSIQTSDVLSQYRTDKRREWKVARGWIAIGDIAQGGLLAIGGISVAPFAFGGLAVGIVCIAPAAIGALFAVGGLAVGGLACGGAAFGGIALGGLAVGYNAIGGAALGYNSAAGGAACAYNYAFGGAACAKLYAVGGAAAAAEANTELAKQMIEKHTFKSWIDYSNYIFIIVIPVALSQWAYIALGYEKPKKTK